MFTGLVETTGTILSVTPSAGATRITVASGSLTPRLRTGDSVAVNGTCLTALDIDPAGTPPRFSADLAAETLARTTLGRLHPGSTVNLELPTPAGAPLGGHVVQGHVDGTATLTSLVALHPESPSTSDWRLRLSLPKHLTRFVVPQGSLTVEGISLTVASLHPTAAAADTATADGTGSVASTGNAISTGNASTGSAVSTGSVAGAEAGVEVEIAIIPHTYASTNLHTLTPGTPLNIETDVLARYAEQQKAEPTSRPGFHLSISYLLANGY